MKNSSQKKPSYEEIFRNDPMVIAFDTSALLSVTKNQLKSLLIEHAIPCITAGILLEIGDRSPKQRKPTFGKLKHWKFKCLHERMEIIDFERRKKDRELSDFSPIMQNSYDFKFEEAVNNLCNEISMPDYDKFRSKRLKRRESWRMDALVNKKDLGFDEITHSNIDDLAKHLWRLGPKGVTDKKIKNAYNSYNSLSFDELPPAFKGLFRLDAFIRLIKPFKKDQKKGIVKLRHASGIEKIKVDHNTLDDMRHFLAALSYIDMVVTNDMGMLRLLGICHPDQQQKVKMLQRK